MSVRTQEKISKSERNEYEYFMCVCVVFGVCLTLYRREKNVLLYPSFGKYAHSRSVQCQCCNTLTKFQLNAVQFSVHLSKTFRPMMTMMMM